MQVLKKASAPKIKIAAGVAALSGAVFHTASNIKQYVQDKRSGVEHSGMKAIGREGAAFGGKYAGAFGSGVARGAVRNIQKSGVVPDVMQKASDMYRSAKNSFGSIKVKGQRIKPVKGLLK